MTNTLKQELAAQRAAVQGKTFASAPEALSRTSSPPRSGCAMRARRSRPR